jgi:hypothetical protein
MACIEPDMTDLARALRTVLNATQSSSGIGNYPRTAECIPMGAAVPRLGSGVPGQRHWTAKVTENDTVAQSWTQLMIAVGLTIAVMLVIADRRPANF